MSLQPDHIGDGDPAVAAEVAGDHGGQCLDGLAVPGIGDGHAGAHQAALTLNRQSNVIAGDRPASSWRAVVPMGMARR